MILLIILQNVKSQYLKMVYQKKPILWIQPEYDIWRDRKLFQHAGVGKSMMKSFRGPDLASHVPSRTTFTKRNRQTVSVWLPGGKKRNSFYALKLVTTLDFFWKLYCRPPSIQFFRNSFNTTIEYLFKTILPFELVYRIWNTTILQHSLAWFILPTTVAGKTMHWQFCKVLSASPTLWAWNQEKILALYFLKLRGRKTQFWRGKTVVYNLQ